MDVENLVAAAAVVNKLCYMFVISVASLLVVFYLIPKMYYCFLVLCIWYYKKCAFLRILC